MHLSEQKLTIFTKLRCRDYNKLFQEHLKTEPRLARRAFLKTPEDFSGPKAIFEIQTLSIRGEDFSPETSAKFLVDLRFFRLAFKTNEN